MFRTLAILTVATLVPLSLHGQDRPAPAAAEKAALSQAASKPDTSADYSQEAYLFEKLATVYHFENDGRGFRIHTGRCRVQSEAALQSLGQLVFAYSASTERMTINFVRVVGADGSVVNAGEGAVQDMTSAIAREAPVYSDLREKHITVPSLRPGAVLEYEIRVDYQQPLAPGQFWMDYVFENGVITLSETLELDVPAGRKLQIKTQPGFEPKTAEANGRRSYAWTSQFLKRPDEKKTSAKPKKPRDRADVAASTFATWDELAAWYAGLEKDRTRPSPELAAKARELTRDAKTDREKAQAIYDFVAKNFRYVSLSFGVGRYQPHAASEVFANQYGDCKDKHTLLAAMLGVVNINADTVLIHSQRKLDRDVPAPSQFDHVITAVHVGPERVIVDTTSEIAPFGALWGAIRHKDAVLVTAAGKSEIVQTPAGWPMPTVQKIEVDGRISELGRLERTVKYTSRGDLELAFRSVLRKLPQPNWQEFVQRVANLDGMAGEVSDIKTGDISDTRSPFELTFTMVTPNFVDFTSKKSKFALPLPHIRLPGLDVDDADPADLTGEDLVQTSIRIIFPVRYKLTLPVPVTMKREYAEFRSSYQFDKGVLTASRELQVLSPEVVPAQAASLDAFRNVVTKDAAQDVGFETDEVAASAATKGASEDEIFDAAGSAYRSRNYKMAADLYEKVLELNPKHKRAWTYLGQSYVADGRLEKAESAYRKQVELSPYDEIVYNSLGLLYERMHKYDDAAAQYRKQIEINPLDRYAHRNLGLMLVRRRQFEQSIPELEQAVSINGEDAFVQQQLGNAYLKTGRKDKALETYDKVLKASPIPQIWNNVAYALAEEKVSIDRARKYAESAVATTIAALNSLPLDQVIEKGPRLSDSLASYWDTLGWVYFQEGNLDEAEKYVRASWEIAQGGEVGDHLAQIYQKREMKDRAVEMFAEAMSAVTPVQETRGRLAALVGEKQVDALVDSTRGKLGEARTYPLGKATQDGDAEFHIVLRGRSVEDVSFAKGSSWLREFADKLKALKYPALGANSDTRLYRLGIVTCSKAAACNLVLVPSKAAFEGATDVPQEIQRLFDRVGERQ